MPRLTVLLALRRDAPVGASWSQRFFCWLIRARLASQWCHGGIVIDGVLYHSTCARGPHALSPGQWTPAHWDLIDIGGDDAHAMREFVLACTPPNGRWRRLWWRVTKGYDVFSLFAFVGLAVRVSWLHYCFELCYRMRAGVKPDFKVAPELLIWLFARSAAGPVDAPSMARSGHLIDPQTPPEGD